MKTAGKSAGIVSITDRKTVESRTGELVYVTISVVDANGNFCPLDASKIKFRIEGPGKIKAVGNGDATSLEAFTGTEIKAFYGKCLAIIEPNGTAGSIKLKAESEGLKCTETVIQVGNK